MSKQLFEQWRKHIRGNSGFVAGMASVANVSGFLPPLDVTTWMVESASDQEKLSEDWQKVAGDFGSAFEKTFVPQKK